MLGSIVSRASGIASDILSSGLYSNKSAEAASSIQNGRTVKPANNQRQTRNSLAAAGMEDDWQAAQYEREQASPGPSRPRRGENQASDGDDIVAVGGRKTRGTGSGSKARAPLVAAAGKPQKNGGNNGYSPYTAGSTKTATSGQAKTQRRADQEYDLVVSQQHTFKPVPADRMYGTSDARHMYPRDTSRQVLHEDRRRVSRDAQNDRRSSVEADDAWFAEQRQMKASGSNQQRAGRAPAHLELNDHRPKANNNQDRKAARKSTPSGRHAASEQADSPTMSGESRSASPVKRKLQNGDHITVISDGEDEAHPLARSVTTKRPRNLGADESVAPIGQTKGEKGKARAGRDAVGLAQQTLDKAAKQKPTPRSRADKTTIPSSGISAASSVNVRQSYLSMQPVINLRTTSICWDPQNRSCSIRGPGKQTLELPMRHLSGKHSMFCAESEAPYLHFCFDTGDVSDFRRQLEILHGVSFDQQTIEIRLFLFKGAPSGTFVDVIARNLTGERKMSIIKSGDVKNILTAFQIDPSVGQPGCEEAKKRADAADRRMNQARQSQPAAQRERHADTTGTKGGKRGKLLKTINLDDNQSTLPFGKETRAKSRKTDTEPVDVPSSPEKAKPAAVGSRKSLRQRDKAQTVATPYEVSDDELFEPAPVVVPAPALPRPENWNGVLFPYPLTGRADINITEGDKWRVAAGDFLNDTLIEFGLKYVLSELRAQPGGVDIDKDVYLFNSFFYEKLSLPAKPGTKNDVSWAAYTSVRKWTKSANVFDKKYLIIPINENAHWYLAVIFNPGGILRSHEPPAKTPATDALVDVTDAAQLPSVTAEEVETVKADIAKASEDARADTRSSSTRGVEDREQVEMIIPAVDTSTEITEITDSPGPSARTRRSGRLSESAASVTSTSPVLGAIARLAGLTHSDDVSADPLDSIPRPSGMAASPSAQSSQAPSLGPGRKRINRARCKPDDSATSSASVHAPSRSQRPIDISASPDPKPIVSLTLQNYALQNGFVDSVAPAKEEEEEVAAAVEEVEKEADPARPAAPAKTAAKPKERTNIWDGEDAWIFTFDSLGGKHPPVYTCLKRWLEHEAKDKKQIDYVPTPARYKEARVPQQPNFSDCGLYLIHYVEHLLKEPEGKVRLIEEPIPGGHGAEKTKWLSRIDQVWNEADTRTLREQWTKKIDVLKEQRDKDRAALLPAAPVASGAGDAADAEEEDHMEIMPASQSVKALSQAPAVDKPKAEAAAEPEPEPEPEQVAEEEAEEEAVAPADPAEVESEAVAPDGQAEDVEMGEEEAYGPGDDFVGVELQNPSDIFAPHSLDGLHVGEDDPMQGTMSAHSPGSPFGDDDDGYHSQSESELAKHLKLAKAETVGLVDYASRENSAAAGNPGPSVQPGMDPRLQQPSHGPFTDPSLAADVPQLSAVPENHAPEQEDEDEDGMRGLNTPEAPNPQSLPSLSRPRETSPVPGGLPTRTDSILKQRRSEERHQAALRSSPRPSDQRNISNGHRAISVSSGSAASSGSYEVQEEVEYRTEGNLTGREKSRDLERHEGDSRRSAKGKGRKVKENSPGIRGTAEMDAPSGTSLADSPQLNTPSGHRSGREKPGRTPTARTDPSEAFDPPAPRFTPYAPRSAPLFSAGWRARSPSPIGLNKPEPPRPTLSQTLASGSSGLRRSPSPRAAPSNPDRSTRPRSLSPALSVDVPLYQPRPPPSAKRASRPSSMKAEPDRADLRTSPRKSTGRANHQIPIPPAVNFMQSLPLSPRGSGSALPHRSSPLSDLLALSPNGSRSSPAAAATQTAGASHPPLSPELEEPEEERELDKSPSNLRPMKVVTTYRGHGPRKSARPSLASATAREDAVDVLGSSEESSDEVSAAPRSAALSASPPPPRKPTSAKASSSKLVSLRVSPPPSLQQLSVLQKRKADKEAKSSSASAEASSSSASKVKPRASRVAVVLPAKRRKPDDDAAFTPAGRDDESSAGETGSGSERKKKQKTSAKQERSHAKGGGKGNKGKGVDREAAGEKEEEMDELATDDSTRSPAEKVTSKHFDQASRGQAANGSAPRSSRSSARPSGTQDKPISVLEDD